MNAAYIRGLGQNDLAGRLLPILRESGLDADIDSVLAFVPHIQERIKVLSEASEWIDFAYVDDLSYDAGELLQKRLTPQQAAVALEAAAAALEALPEYSETAIEAALRAQAEASGLKAREFFGAVRVAATGKAVAPPLFGSLAILGQARTVRRLKAAIAALAALG